MILYVEHFILFSVFQLDQVENLKIVFKFTWTHCEQLKIIIRGFYEMVFMFLQIRSIDRKQEVPHDGPMCDLLWSDPEGLK